MNQNSQIYNWRSADLWKQGQLVEVAITDLGDTGVGVGRFQERVVFVPDAVPGDRALVRLVQVKRQYARSQLRELLEPSRYRVRPNCIVADKCGGCQWQHIDYSYQLTAKRDLVVRALERIGGINQPRVDPVLTADAPLGYRNKATYPLRLSSTGRVQAGYYQKGSHKLVNLNRCPVQDQRLNPLLAEVKQDIQQLGWQVYNERHHRGQLRHLSLRIGRRTGDILLTLVATDWNLPGITEQAGVWLQRYPGLAGVFLNCNPKRTNAIFGAQSRCVAGRSYLQEEFAGLQFQLTPDTFFQVNTETAEMLVEVLTQELQLQGNEVLVDAYCGIGTFTLPLALRVKQAIGLEVRPEAVWRSRENAKLNRIANVTFREGMAERLLPQLEAIPDIVLLDPPRQGCDRAAIAALLQLQPKRIVYISCKPSTLARDLKIFCQEGGYRLVRVQPADFFPQTSHIECAAFLESGERSSKK